MNETTTPLLIGLAGAAGAGKDTAAAYLEDQYAFCALGFADPLRDMLGALFHHADVDGAWMVERELKEQPVAVLGRSYRQMAQTLGTEWGRQQMGEDFWLRIAAHRVGQVLALGSNAVITDVRFPNEAAWITAQGGTVVRLIRPGLPGVRPHESEQHFDALPCSTTLYNAGSKSGLRDLLDGLIDDLRKGTRP